MLPRRSPIAAGLRTAVEPEVHLTRGHARDARHKIPRASSRQQDRNDTKSADETRSTRSLFRPKECETTARKPPELQCEQQSISNNTNNNPLNSTDAASPEETSLSPPTRCAPSLEITRRNAPGRWGEPLSSSWRPLRRPLLLECAPQRELTGMRTWSELATRPSQSTDDMASLECNL